MIYLIETVPNERYEGDPSHAESVGFTLVRDARYRHGILQEGRSWVLHDPTGEVIDYDQFRFNLQGRHNLSLKDIGEE